MDKEISLTFDEVHRRLSYDPETGIFTRKVRTTRGPSGSVAGDTDLDGYWRISIFGKKYRAGRLAIFMMTGAWPAALVDHMNGIRSDNRFDNLRVVDHAGNARNSIHAGIEKMPSGRFRARIAVGRKNLHLGSFDSREQARAAYFEAKRNLHPTWNEKRI